MDIHITFSHFLKIFLLVKLLQTIHCLNPIEIHKTFHTDTKRDVGFLLIGNKLVNSTENISKLLLKTKYSNQPTTKFRESNSTRISPSKSKKTTQKSKVTTKMKETSLKYHSSFESTKDVTSVSPTSDSSKSKFLEKNNTTNILNFQTTLKTDRDVENGLRVSTTPSENENGTEIRNSTAVNEATLPVTQPVEETRQTGYWTTAHSTTEIQNSSKTRLNVPLPTKVVHNTSVSDTKIFQLNTTTSPSLVQSSENYTAHITTQFAKEQTSLQTTDNQGDEQRSSTVTADIFTGKQAYQSTNWKSDKFNVTEMKIPLTTSSLAMTSDAAVDIQSTSALDEDGITTHIVASTTDSDKTSVHIENMFTNNSDERKAKLNDSSKIAVSTSEQTTVHGNTIYHLNATSAPDFKPTIMMSNSDITTESAFDIILNSTEEISETSASQVTTLSYQPISNASYNNSEGAYITNIQLKPKKDGDDTYWPIAMAITIAVPTIIVVGITITVIHKKRKLERAHTLTGYITPPMEYDV